MIALMLLFDLCKHICGRAYFRRLLIGAGGCVNNHLSLISKDLVNKTLQPRHGFNASPFICQFHAKCVPNISDALPRCEA
jgi:hypothetical protein